MPHQFGAFRVTDDTRHRPTVLRFEPRFDLDKDILADITAIEALDRGMRRHAVDGAAAERIRRQALARNTFGTVNIEGNPVTLEQVESLLVAAPSHLTALLPDERDVLNIGRFLERLEDAAPPRSPDDLAALHDRLFAGTVRRPGRFKQQPNFIGDRRSRSVAYVPTAPERVHPELESALAWYHSDTNHPLVRIAVFFHELQSIHPFDDGNGRLGRAVAALQLHHEGYPGARYAPVDYAINEDRSAYYEALAATQGGAWDLSAWVRYFVSVLLAAYQDAERRFVFGDRLPVGVSDRALDVLTWIARRDRAAPGRELKVADVHAAFPEVPRRTLQRDLSLLVQAAVLERLGAGRGARYRLPGPA